MTHLFASCRPARPRLLSVLLSVLLAGLLAVSLPFAARAQTSVGIGTTAPNAKAALEIVSSDKGLLIPRMTAADRGLIAAPVPAGLLVYQTDGAQPGFWYYAASGGWTFLNPVGVPDNLGNHTATTNLGLNGNWLSNAPGNANGIRVDNGGKVGVGTGSPATTLDVRTTDNTATITVGKTDATAGALYLGNSGHGLRRNYNGGANDVGLYTTAGTLHLSASGGSASQLTLLNNGNVGIGVSPTQKLDVAGNTNVTGNTTVTGNTAVTGNTTVTGNTAVTGNSTVSGNVGIGTTSPSQKLDVAGATATATVGTTSLLRLTRPHNSGNKWANSAELALGTYGTTANSESRLDVKLANGATDNPDATVLSALANGNVGIGTTSPTQKLEVAGQIFSSTGGIRFPDNTVQTTAASSTNYILNQTALQSGANFNIGGNGTVGGNAVVSGNAVISGTVTIGSGVGAGAGSTVVQPVLQVNGLTYGTSAVVDQNQSTVNSIHNTADFWQSFTAGRTGNFTQLAPLVRSPTGAVGAPGTLTLYAGEGTGGAVLLTQAFTFATTSFNFQSIPLTTSLPVVAGQQYTYRIQLPASGSTSWLQYSPANPYAGGRAVHGAGYDAGFMTYVQAENVSPVLTTLSTGNVGIGTVSPVASAALDITSTTRGFLPPRMLQTERDAIVAPAAGLTIYNTTTNKLNTWNGTTWGDGLSGNEQPYLGPSASFAYTGGLQTYVVPADVYSVTVDARGARGGNSDLGPLGGLGSRIQATIPVTPGETLTVVVGGAGFQAFNVEGGGYNGGGHGFLYGCGGGGGSDVRRGPTYADRLVVAGGGGGATRGGSGGAGGYPTGLSGANSTGTGGGGGTQTGPGSGGSPPAGFGYGGEATCSRSAGGGGGYWGGGGGSPPAGIPNCDPSQSAAGGGGSSWVTPVGGTLLLTETGTVSGHGSVVISPGPRYAAPALNGANFVNVPGDNLGNHTATQNLNLGTNTLVGTTAVNVGNNLNLGTNKLVGNGGTAGISILGNGNVGIGTATATQALDVNGGILARGNGAISNQGAYLQWNRTGGEGETWLLNQKGGGTANAGIRFGSATTANVATEWARFNDSGNLGLGTTSPDAKLDVESNAAQQLVITSTSTDPTGVISLTIPATNSACNTCSEYVLFNKAGGGTIGSIGSNLSGNSVTYNTSSDKRLKEHITRTRFGLNDLLKIEVKDYNFIGTAAANRVTGFLAQDLFRIYPDAVKEGDHGPTVTNQWAVDYGRITPLLVQAIQDQQAIIDAQRAEIEALKTRHTTQTHRADRAEAAQTADHAALQTLQEQMARLLGEVPPATQARK